MRWAKLSLLLVLAATSPTDLWPGSTRTAWAQGTQPDTLQPPKPEAILEFEALISGLRASAQQQDSLGALADTSKGERREVYSEQIWERQDEIESRLLALVENLHRQESAGDDFEESRRITTELIRRGWPRYQGLLRDYRKDFEILRRQSESASGAERLVIESRLSEAASRQANRLHSLVDVILALEGAGIDVSKPREFVIENLTALGEELVSRLRVMERDREATAMQAARAPTDNNLRQELFAIEERRNRASENLTVAIALLDRFDVETSRFKVSLISSTGKLTADVFSLKVIGGLLQVARKQVWDILVKQVSRWLLQGLVLALILAGFWLLASLTRRIVRRAVARANVSQLMRETILAASARLVMGIGVIVALAQLGVEVSALFAGLGIAGFVIGFAMQSTLSNFAAGGMILAYRPFDVGDVIEAGGASGTVRAMSLVATTIVSADNQTLIIPNSKIWGDVIRNSSARPTRRVDLTFGVGYEEDLDRAERVLKEILAGCDKVLPSPAADVRVHHLADGAVNIVVRPWARQEDYQEVYWEITKAVKQRFDQEGIAIPSRRREVYLHATPGKPPESTASVPGESGKPPS